MVVLLVCGALVPARAEPVEERIRPLGIVEPWRVVHLERLQSGGREVKGELLRELRRQLELSAELVLDLDGLLCSLESLAKGDDSELSILALQVLAALGPDAFPALATLRELAASRGARDDLRLQAVLGIIAVGVPLAEAESLARPLLDAVDAATRLDAAATLIHLSNRNIDSVMPVIVSSLEFPELRHSALGLIERLGPDAQAVVPALEALKIRLRQNRARRFEIDLVSHALLKVKGQSATTSPWR